MTRSISRRMIRSMGRATSQMTSKERRAREAALNQLLDDIDARTYPQVADAIDFARLDTIEQHVVAELERLIGEGKLPTPPSTEIVARQAQALIATLLYRVAQDPRRTKHSAEEDEEDCELCRAFGGPAWVS